MAEPWVFLTWWHGARDPLNSSDSLSGLLAKQSPRKKMNSRETRGHIIWQVQQLFWDTVAAPCISKIDLTKSLSKCDSSWKRLWSRNNLDLRIIYTHPHRNKIAAPWGRLECFERRYMTPGLPPYCSHESIMGRLCQLHLLTSPLAEEPVLLIPRDPNSDPCPPSLRFCPPACPRMAAASDPTLPSPTQLILGPAPPCPVEWLRSWIPSLWKWVWEAVSARIWPCQQCRIPQHRGTWIHFLSQRCFGAPGSI